MSDNSRIDDLRRRVQKDPSSIAFAQLAEELRRAGRCDEAVEVCHAGLAIHPAYLSARVTLGRALVELNQLDDALAELERVLKSAPENLAAIRGVAEIFHRRGDLAQALRQYRDALALAKNDPDLQQTVADLAKQVEPQQPAHVADGLSFEQMDELFKAVPAPPKPVPHESEQVPTPEAPPLTEAHAGPIEPVEPIEPPADSIAPAGGPGVAGGERGDPAAESHQPIAQDAKGSADTVESVTTADHARAEQTIATLERWLDAIHAARTQRGA